MALSWYCSREQIKAAGKLFDSARDGRIDDAAGAATRKIERLARRFFIPRTETRLYRFPGRHAVGSVVELDTDLRSVSALLTKAQDDTPTTISSDDFFLEPANTGPPYSRIEIDLSSTAALESGDTPQRSISVAGVWGYAAESRAAGTVDSGLASSATATSMVCSDAGLIDVGATLLIESEQVFVSERAYAARGAIKIDGALAKDMAETTVTVDGSHELIAGEVIQVDAERMLILSISTNDLAVVRAYEGTVVATHSDEAPVLVARTLTIVRAHNGTTAVTHANSTAITRYVAPEDVQELALAYAVSSLAQGSAAWGRAIGSGDGAREFSARGIRDLERTTLGPLRRARHIAA